VITMKNKMYIFLWYIISPTLLCAGGFGGPKRVLRVVFVNEAREDVFVAIHEVPSVPLEREIVVAGTRTYFFPRALDENTFYHIIIKSASHEAYYTLHFSGNLLVSDAHACRAYGELQLMMQDWVVQTLSAGSLKQGLVLVYNADFELRFGIVYMTDRPHKSECRAQREKTGCCVCRSACHIKPVQKKKSMSVQALK
jgi:hypothetical protein